MKTKIIGLLTVVTAVALTLPARGQESVRGVRIITSVSRPTATVWDALVAGNREFASGRVECEDPTAERIELSDHQHPTATVLGCSDSRVAPERVFNQGLGSLFVIRNAGSIADDFGVASIEYAVLHGYTELIVVLGHQSCGAVTAALDPADPGTPALRQVVERIRRSFVGSRRDRNDPAVVRRAVEENARASAAALLAESSVIREAVESGEVELVAAYYDFASGEVRRID